MVNSILQRYLQFIKRRLPPETEGPVIGLDLTESSCRAVELSLVKDRYELVRCFCSTMAGQDERSVLKDLVSGWQPDMTERDVLVALSGRGTLVRYLDMPRMPAKELRRAMAIEADKYLPFPKDTIHMDAVILDPHGTGRRMTVLVAAAKKEIVEARQKFFREGAVSLAGMTMGPVALANAFLVFSPDPEGRGPGAQAIVHVGEVISTLLIMMREGPRFSRDIFMGSQDVVRAFGNIQGVSLAEAWGVMDRPRQDEGGGDLAQAAKPMISNLIGEVRLSLDYFATEKNVMIERVVLTGPGGMLPGIVGAFEDRLGLPALSWDPFEQIQISDPTVRETVRQRGPAFVLALGLAVGGYDQG